MFSRKFPSTHPNFIPDFSPASTAQTFVKSLISGSGPATLLVPLNANIDGSKIPIFLSGRVTLYTGATPGSFHVKIFHGTSYDTNHAAASADISLPANASGAFICFALTVTAVYDFKSQTIVGFTQSVIAQSGTSIGSSSSVGGFVLPVVVGSQDLRFTAEYDFTVAPLSGTTVEITEFRFGQ